MLLRKLSIEEINKMSELIDLIVSLYEVASPNFYEYEFNGMKRYLYREDNYCTILYLDGDGILYTSFCLDENYDLCYMEFDTFNASKGNPDQVWQEGSDIMESLIYTKNSNTKPEDFYDGVVCYTQTKVDTGESLSAYYETFYSNDGKLGPINFKRLKSYFYQKGKKVYSFVCSRIEPNTLFYEIITIKEFGLIDVLSKGSCALQMDPCMNRFFKLPRLPKGKASITLSPFYQTYTTSQMDDIFKKCGFKTSVPDYLIDYYNREYEEQEEYEVLSSAIKQYDEIHQDIMKLNLK
ncbi:MAG: hypothetical protein IJ475_00945 [Bacilli bacterium]|nr:hypothetical protein [Bacilli bacterium]